MPENSCGCTSGPCEPDKARSTTLCVANVQPSMLRGRKHWPRSKAESRPTQHPPPGGRPPLASVR
eukprot:364988-Chlamydomonas_euryale.AAC.21